MSDQRPGRSTDAGGAEPSPDWKAGGFGLMSGRETSPRALPRSSPLGCVCPSRRGTVTTAPETGAGRESGGRRLRPKRSVRCDPLGSGRGPVARALRCRADGKQGNQLSGERIACKGGGEAGNGIPTRARRRQRGRTGAGLFPPQGSGTVWGRSFASPPTWGRGAVLPFDRRGRGVSRGGPRVNTVPGCSHRQWGVRVGGG